MGDELAEGAGGGGATERGPFVEDVEHAARYLRKTRGRRQLRVFAGVVGV
jgi:hypothetical protein